jgi:hypothetical protein
MCDSECMCVYLINSDCNDDYCDAINRSVSLWSPRYITISKITLKNQWTCNFTRAIFNRFVGVYSHMHPGLKLKKE